MYALHSDLLIYQKKELKDELNAMGVWLTGEEKVDELTEKIQEQLRGSYVT